MSVALEPLRSAPPPDSPELRARAARLRASFEAGHTRALDWRREQLAGLRRLLHERRGALVAALQADLGKPESESAAGELAPVALAASVAQRRLRVWTRPERIGALSLPGRRQMQREPLGVVLIVSPWSHPLGLLLAPLVGALAAGNCAALVPPESASRTGELLANLVPRYLDPGAVAVVEGGLEGAAALLDQRFDHIFYTGRGRTARLAMRAAARQLTPITMQRVGQSPCIVDADVDLREVAAHIAWGKFLHAGQTSSAPDYVLVPERRERELVDALAAAIRELLGPDPIASPRYAAIANRQRFERLVSMLGDGEIAVGGEVRDEACAIAPTVLRRVRPDAPIMAAETFSPILPVFGVRTATEAIDFVNDRDDPLQLYVFSKDLDVQLTAVEQTRAVRACVNGVPHIGDRAFPLGDVTAGGVGADSGRQAFDRLSRRVSVLNRSGRFESRWLYPTYTRLKAKWVERKL